MKYTAIIQTDDLGELCASLPDSAVLIKATQTDVAGTTGTTRWSNDTHVQFNDAPAWNGLYSEEISELRATLGEQVFTYGELKRLVEETFAHLEGKASQVRSTIKNAHILTRVHA